MDAFFIKQNASTLTCATEHDQELLRKVKIGNPIRMSFIRVRNYEFHKKYFALLNFAYDYWEPPYNEVGEKNFDRFRKDIIILAGFYERSVRINGETRVEAKSISFSSMSEDEFEILYEKTIDVIINYVCTQFTGQMLRDTVAMTEEFA
jgi:hypothetical protein